MKNTYYTEIYPNLGLFRTKTKTKTKNKNKNQNKVPVFKTSKN